jgi:hypothetical protein
MHADKRAFGWRTYVAFWGRAYSGTEGTADARG